MKRTVQIDLLILSLAAKAYIHFIDTPLLTQTLFRRGRFIAVVFTSGMAPALIGRKLSSARQFCLYRQKRYQPPPSSLAEQA